MLVLIFIISYLLLARVYNGYKLLLLDITFHTISYLLLDMTFHTFSENLRFPDSLNIYHYMIPLLMIHM